MTRTINIARDFSRSPAGRHVGDGPYSGEAFREKILVPALRASDEVLEVDLNGALGFGSSFLEEAFGGLVREHHFQLAELRQRIRILTELRTYEQRIWHYVEDAQRALPH